MNAVLWNGLPRIEAHASRWHVWLAFAGRRRRLVLYAKLGWRTFSERYGYVACIALGPLTLGFRRQERDGEGWWQ